ncbi:DUF1302 family protein [Solimonas sp. K1W22B-7]|uniref:DUF1302 domain-containing protein n=1 Tax=Solimonas sp. K1W22B-7 TaxID=2303331 RepID=UPI000E32EF83|nr:DUF1302 family protein [Solimonas sp. K1W22B-7]AXQ29159.1 DUF1302 family protein [Solimonas sp. K1W22B-7]
MAAAKASRGGGVAVLALLILLSPAARAESWTEGWDTDWKNRVTLGAQLRTEARDPALVGKANLDPQLCAQDDCLSASPNNTEPNERYLAAPGARNMVYDEGNLNYDRGDLIASPLKWTSTFQLRRDDLIFHVGALGFYDFTNASLKEYHPNQIVQPGPQPGQPVRNERDREAIKDIGYNLQLLDAYVQDTFDVFGRPLDVSIGRQRIIWGESSFVTQGSLNVINPPDANNLVRPGQDFEEVYRPVGMLLLRMPLSDEISTEAFYQFEWRPVGIPSRGSYFSFFNAGNEVTENEGISAPFGKIPYDPLQVGTPANDVFDLVTQTSFTLRRAPNREPDDLGQFGMALYYHPEWLDGSELGLYAANYHSRIPAASAYASAASCTRREGNPSGIDAVDLTSFVAACGVPGTHLRDAAPLDSVRYFVDYPEDVRLFGLSFSTLAAGVAVRGELAYRPNQPVQVDLEDVLFAAFQPALPRQDIPLFGTDQTLPGLIAALQDSGNVSDVLLNTIRNLPGAIGALQGLLAAPNLLGTTVPGSRRIPDFVTGYRGGAPGEIVPGQYIRGYERMKVAQGSLGLTRIFGNTALLGTTDSLLLFELTGIWLPDLPSQSQLQFEGPGTDTHAGPGAHDTGNALFLNPIRNTGGYVTSFSWGYRAGAMLHYSDVLKEGLNVRPLLVFTHDVSGVSPGLGENFLEGRKIAIFDVRLNYGPFDASVAQTFLFGGGDRNTLHDRDFFTASIGMRF